MYLSPLILLVMFSSVGTIERRLFKSGIVGLVGVFRMNRKERRKAARESGVKAPAQKVYMLTYEQLEKIKDDAINAALNGPEMDKIKEQAMNRALRVLLAMPVVILHDKFGFGRVRQQRFLGYMKTWIRAINMDDGTLAEILEIAQKEVGYDVHFLEGGQ